MIRSQPDLIEEYIEDYGFYGSALHTAVMKARLAPPAAPTPTTNVVPGTSVVRPSNQRTLLVPTSQSQPKQIVYVTRPTTPSTVSCFNFFNKVECYNITWGISEAKKDW